MAATRLIAMHQNKGKTIAQCLKDRTNYAMNEEKTGHGELITTYACDKETVDQEFLQSKLEYLRLTGRQPKGDIIAYQIRQSFKPGEITPGEANQVGYETAMRFTKGNHAFIVAPIPIGLISITTSSLIPRASDVTASSKTPGISHSLCNDSVISSVSNTRYPS